MSSLTERLENGEILLLDGGVSTEIRRRGVTLDENVWTQHWQPGDVIVWDNRRVLHRRDGFPGTSRRLLKRCQVLARDREAS